MCLQVSSSSWRMAFKSDPLTLGEKSTAFFQNIRNHLPVDMSPPSQKTRFVLIHLCLILYDNLHYRVYWIQKPVHKVLKWTTACSVEESEYPEPYRYRHTQSSDRDIQPGSWVLLQYVPSLGWRIKGQNSCPHGYAVTCCEATGKKDQWTGDWWHQNGDPAFSQSVSAAQVEEWAKLQSVLQ